MVLGIDLNLLDSLSNGENGDNLDKGQDIFNSKKNYFLYVYTQLNSLSCPRQ